MATLDKLKQALNQAAKETTTLPRQPLSAEQYSAGYQVLQESEWETYRDFIIPTQTQVVEDLLKATALISVLEIGPGPRTMLQHLPVHIRRKTKRYDAYELNASFATDLGRELDTTINPQPPFPYLGSRPKSAGCFSARRTKPACLPPWHTTMIANTI
jgi:hypothetical protein